MKSSILEFPNFFDDVSRVFRMFCCKIAFKVVRFHLIVNLKYIVIIRVYFQQFDYTIYSFKKKKGEGLQLVSHAL